MSMRVSCPAFASGAPIPVRHAGDGDDISPALQWGTAPAGTREICVLCEDPDAPRPKPWVHWLVAGIPPTREGLSEGECEGLVEGHNDFGDVGWGGPMPPRGHGRHRYVFKVFALSRPTGLHGGFSKEALVSAMHGHVLAEGETTGTYERP